ncbi:DUF4402 domain-containing protein [Qipengyuania gaetbuli]|uniref:DUF4402 domain-containing protein n=1 Tax=Qipengyuania gaetbuli TaxID=266952 RepID=UPI001CD46C19|nr:DUF4402 domain-containing protein [Qipengyuania gaetbuli]MCA0909268.1 DUF4402 domain-containing protein [Qipengyuania gaetbuli]
MGQPFSKALFAGILALVTGTFATPLAAQASNSSTVSGSSNARVVEPISITPISDLRFGSLARPATAGIVEVAPDGTVTGNLDLTAFPTGRGPARFTVLGERNRRFIVFTPNRIDISNGTATMRVDRFRDNRTAGFARLDASGSFDLYIGGRLNVNANQQVGTYSGTFDVTVLYL